MSSTNRPISFVNNLPFYNNVQGRSFQMAALRINDIKSAYVTSNVPHWVA